MGINGRLQILPPLTSVRRVQMFGWGAPRRCRKKKTNLGRAPGSANGAFKRFRGTPADRRGWGGVGIVKKT